MKVNITMLTYGREDLTAQAIQSIRDHTSPTVYDLTEYDNQGKTGTGEARNTIIGMVKDRGDYLYLSDNDVAVHPRWLETLVDAYEWARESLGVIALGAYNHPYNGPYQKFPYYSPVLNQTIEVGYVHALALQSWLWKWEDWDRFGPFPETPVGRVCMGEDVAISQKIHAAGGKLAAIYPPLLTNCGVTNSFGQPIPGDDVVLAEPCPEGVLRA